MCFFLFLVTLRITVCFVSWTKNHEMGFFLSLKYFFYDFHKCSLFLNVWNTIQIKTNHTKSHKGVKVYLYGINIFFSLVIFTWVMYFFSLATVYLPEWYWESKIQGRKIIQDFFYSQEHLTHLNWWEKQSHLVNVIFVVVTIVSKTATDSTFSCCINNVELKSL